MCHSYPAVVVVNNFMAANRGMTSLLTIMKRINPFTSARFPTESKYVLLESEIARYRLRIFKKEEEGQTFLRGLIHNVPASAQSLTVLNVVGRLKVKKGYIEQPRTCYEDFNNLSCDAWNIFRIQSRDIFIFLGKIVLFWKKLA